MIFKNPLGREIEIRMDSMGSGLFNASRRTNSGIKIKHDGVDIVCIPGETVYMPFTAIIERVVYPYENDFRIKGAFLTNDDIEIKIFYIELLDDVLNRKLEEGEPFAVCQDISEKHGSEMKPHIHIEIVRVNPLLVMGDVFNFNDEVK